MADTKRKVPNLRFKGFTDDWKQQKLGNISSSFSGGTPSAKNKSYYEGSIPFIRSAEIHKNKTELFITESGLRNSSAKLIKKGTLLYALYGATSGEVDISKINGAINQAILAIFPQKDSVSFIKDYLEKNKSRIITKYLQGGQGNLSASIIKSVLISRPFIEEQKKIGDLIEKVDFILALQQRKLALLKQLKKGLLQKMFADKGSKRPILRFEGFNDDWEGRKLENSADYIRGSFPQPYGNKEWYGGTNAKPFVQVVDVNTNMRLNKKTKEQISVLAQPKSRFVPSDSIVVTLQGSIGRVAITQYDSYVDRTLLIFTKYKVPVDKYFWAYSIQNIFRIEKQKAPGGTIKTITKRALSSFEVSLPVQEEQKKIGTLLKNIDDIITSQQEEVTKLKKIKKSLLQQMFI